jgi:hypothetical protein
MWFEGHKAKQPENHIRRGEAPASEGQPVGTTSAGSVPLASLTLRTDVPDT